MDGGAWWATVHGVTKSQTRLSNFPFTFYFHALEKETATHSNVLAWRIPGTGEPGGLPSMGLHRADTAWDLLPIGTPDCCHTEPPRAKSIAAAAAAAAAAAKSLQSCPTLLDPIYGSPPGSAVPWILQARTLEWVAISFSNA